MLLIVKNVVEDTRANLSKYHHPFVGEVQGILNYIIETSASIKKDPLSAECSDLQPVDLELPDHCIRIPSDYHDECIKIVIHELTKCAEYHIKIIENGEWKTVHY